jgi:hypothetical protein
VYACVVMVIVPLTVGEMFDWFVIKAVKVANRLACFVGAVYWMDY